MSKVAPWASVTRIIGQTRETIIWAATTLVVLVTIICNRHTRWNSHADSGTEGVILGFEKLVGYDSNTVMVDDASVGCSLTEKLLLID